MQSLSLIAEIIFPVCDKKFKIIELKYLVHTYITKVFHFKLFLILN